MLRLAMVRLVLALPLLVVVSFGLVALVSLIPGDPALVLAGTHPELAPAIRQSLHLDDPLLMRYWNWASGAVHGDLGESYVLHESVASLIWARLPTTASLIVLAMLISIFTALVLGTISALNANTSIDRSLTVSSAFAIAAPPFWVGNLLVLWFAVDHQWFPALGTTTLSDGLWPWLSHLVLPAVTLSLWTGAMLTLQLRRALIEVLGRGYILSARAKGLSSVSVVGKHALKNSASPVVTVLGYQLAHLFGGTILVENVFAIPGLGSLALDSTIDRDVPVMLGLVVCTTLLVIVVHFFVDVSYGYFNPKVLPT